MNADDERIAAIRFAIEEAIKADALSHVYLGVDEDTGHIDNIDGWVDTEVWAKAVHAATKPSRGGDGPW